MKAVEIMMAEHQNILVMLNIVRKMSYDVMKGEPINYDDFEKAVFFIKNYADSYHHKKEEDVLFNQMVEHLGATGEKLVKNGMLVEHDFGRLYIRELIDALNRVKNGDEESRLDVIANAISYTHLLHRHIEKEDAVIYKFAERGLSKEVMNIVDKDCIHFEDDNEEMKNKCLEILKKLEEKYC